MLVKVYLVEDDDVIERVYNDNSPVPVSNVGPNFGELVIEDDMRYIPDPGDLMMLKDDETEYAVATRIWFHDHCQLVLVPRLEVGVVLSS